MLGISRNALNGTFRHFRTSLFARRCASVLQRSLPAAIAQNITSAKDAQDVVLTYGLNPAVPGQVRPLAVVKVGGEVIMKELDKLVASLSFLRSCGVLPVVIHGGGPQLNDELAKAGVQPQYIGGHRVTDSATMTVAKRVFEQANDDLANGLRGAGLPVCQIKSGVFRAEVHDAKLGLVGEIKNVVDEAVNLAISRGEIPVLTSVGVSAAGAALNINADVAARELSISLRPLKVLYSGACFVFVFRAIDLPSHCRC
jgi:acetylglutamate kinase